MIFIYHYFCSHQTPKNAKNIFQNTFYVETNEQWDSNLNNSQPQGLSKLPIIYNLGNQKVDPPHVASMEIV